MALLTVPFPHSFIFTPTLLFVVVVVGHTLTFDYIY